MKHLFFYLCALCLCSALSAQPDSIVQINSDLRLIHITDSIFVHESLDEDLVWGRYTSNGLIIIRKGEAIMVDTPTNNQKTRQLVEFIQQEWDVRLSRLIIGHFHADCMGGLEYIQSIGVESISGNLTIGKCKELNLPMPDRSFSHQMVIPFHDTEVICYYLGGGHTIDNIIVWLPMEKLLFGGCLIKSLESRGLGNLSDAVPLLWKETVENVIRHCPNVQWVIPGHGQPGGPELLTHTIDLVDAFFLSE
ncbi:subclass B1 metallo-beta-lactamase [Alkaliflexus imshenetskii]|uniref:subclass B1 metallo-beta-lactamase n=1 Tax=Alkaliflexus imshenetskii TaxID=286730 RepID=UPI0004ADBFEB|nr:subclass B1 metallo-beta-lactamase [Alkaliflexus imshenetskii]